MSKMLTIGDTFQRLDTQQTYIVEDITKSAYWVRLYDSSFKIPHGTLTYVLKSKLDIRKLQKPKITKKQKKINRDVGNAQIGDIYTYGSGQIYLVKLSDGLWAEIFRSKLAKLMYTYKTYGKLEYLKQVKLLNTNLERSYYYHDFDNYFNRSLFPEALGYEISEDNLRFRIGKKSSPLLLAYDHERF